MNGGFRGATYPTQRYADIINLKPQETRSGEEIAADVIQRCGLKVKK